ncbi:MAG: hypothetical protein M1812_001260 [Candelaria pacifica]|nr:MAG: hypothetical protein M1812_001260 [Candelaria pacifica]
MTSPVASDEVNRRTDEGYSSPKPSKFRFKSKRRSSPYDEDTHSSHSSHKRRTSSRPHEHRHHHRSKRRKHSHSHPHQPPDDPSLYDDTYAPNTSSQYYLPPDAAFRESLFDALADDEGAAFWEGVYGQPIHTYASTRAGPEGELERMTDEEYAAHVRAKMYEKTHQHIIEEKARMEEAKKRQKEWKEQTKKMERERNGFEKAVVESLRRGQERRKGKRWREIWEGYVRGWEELKRGGVIGDDEGDGESPKRKVRDRIPWPVESGRWKDVNKDEVEQFMLKAPFANTESDAPPLELAGVLKLERVRWHPDKIQQRLGSNGIDESTMKAVTAVFQVLDRMWNDMREKAKSQ